MKLHSINSDSLLALLFFSISLVFVSQIKADVNNGIEFSAKAIQKAPDRDDYQSKMYIGNQMVRTDSQVNGVKLIEIQDTSKKMKYFLVPEQKVYMELKLSNPNAPEVEITEDTKPCDGIPNTECKLLATENIFGRPSEKWEFIVQVPDSEHPKTMRSLHWIDVERRMIVREFLPNGKIVELIPQGNVTVNNRTNEKWLWQVSDQNGVLRSSTQWYDPELKMTTREEIKGGYLRELIDIKVEKQPKRLFSIPKGFMKVNDLKKYINPINNQGLNN